VAFTVQGARKLLPHRTKMQIGLRWARNAPGAFGRRSAKRGSATPGRFSGAVDCHAHVFERASRSPRINFRSSALSARVLPRLDAGVGIRRCVQVNASCYASTTR